MNTLRKIAATVALIGLTISLCGAKDPLHSVPFRLFGEKIFLTANVLDSYEISVLFDPGTYAYMHSGTAQKLGVQYSEVGKMSGSASGKATKTNMFSNFGVAFEGFNDSFKTVRSQAAPYYLNKRVDFVFGKEWIDRFIVFINYEERRIHLYKQGALEIPEEYEKIECLNWPHYPVVKAQIRFDNDESGEFNMELNAGSELGFVLGKQAVKDYKLLKVQRDRGVIRIFGPTGEGIEGTLTRVQSIQIGSQKMSLVKGGLFPRGYDMKVKTFVNGQVGQPFLKFYNVIFDKQNNLVYLKRKGEPEDD